MMRLPKPLVVGAVLAMALALLALLAPLAGDPWKHDLDSRLAPPSTAHPLGTDGLGRDVASRLAHGARTSLAVGALSALFALAVGLPLGATAGYRGGWSDRIVARAIEIVLCFPSLLLVLALLETAPAWLRELPEVVRIALVLGATGWVPVARYLRAEFVKLRGSEMVLAARAAGGGGARIALRHVLPSALAPVVVTAAFAVAGAITLEAALSFLGLGVAPPVPTWGNLLAEARHYIDGGWWLAVFPGAALFLALTACNLLGEGLRQQLDPRARVPAK